MDMKKKVLRTDQAVVLGISTLVTGFVLGMVTYHVTMGGPSEVPAQVRMAQAPGMGMPPPSSGSQAVAPPGATIQHLAEEVREAKKVVERDPKNRAAWVTLGNILFDNNQAQEAIAAYTKALEMDGKDANVITDRGILYRRLGDFQAAVRDFERASQIDPNHFQCLYHLGLTRLHDLQDIKGAKAAWEAMLRRPVPPELAADIQNKLQAMSTMPGMQ